MGIVSVSNTVRLALYFTQFGNLEFLLGGFAASTVCPDIPQTMHHCETTMFSASPALNGLAGRAFFSKKRCEFLVQISLILTLARTRYQQI